MPRLVAEELVLVCLHRADDDVERVLLHRHPVVVARLIVVGAQRGGASRQVLLEPGILGELGGLGEVLRRAFVLGGEELVVRDRDEPPGVITADDGVQALERITARLRRGRRRIEFALGHPVGVEIRSGRLAADLGDEGFVVRETVPGTVVDLDELPRVGARHVLEERVLVAVALAPEGAVHRPRRIDEERDHLALLRRQHRGVGGERHRGVLREHRLGVIGRPVVGGPGGRGLGRVFGARRGDERGGENDGRELARHDRLPR